MRTLPDVHQHRPAPTSTTQRAAERAARTAARKAVWHTGRRRPSAAPGGTGQRGHRAARPAGAPPVCRCPRWSHRRPWSASARQRTRTPDRANSRSGDCGNAGSAGAPGDRRGAAVCERGRTTNVDAADLDSAGGGWRTLVIREVGGTSSRGDRRAHGRSRHASGRPTVNVRRPPRRSRSGRPRSRSTDVRTVPAHGMVVSHPRRCAGVAIVIG